MEEHKSIIDAQALAEAAVAEEDIVEQNPLYNPEASNIQRGEE